jgi:hypothetical protein
VLDPGKAHKKPRIGKVLGRGLDIGIVSGLWSHHARTLSGVIRRGKFGHPRWRLRRDAATYVPIGFSIALFSIMTHSDFTVAAQEMKPLAARRD